MSYPRPAQGGVGGQRQLQASSPLLGKAPGLSNSNSLPPPQKQHQQQQRGLTGNSGNISQQGGQQQQLRQHGNQIAPKSGHMVGVMGGVGGGGGGGGGAGSSGGTGAVAAAAGGGAGQQPVAKSMAAFRSLELCDRLKLEIENITSEISAHQVEREEYEKKFRGQLVEMDRIQLSLKQLQEAHILMKQQYEDEIFRLRHKLEHPHSQGPDGPGVGRLPSSVQGLSGALNMGSTGMRHAHGSSPQAVRRLGSMGLAAGAGHGLASPRKHDGRSPMLGPPGAMMGGGGGPGGLLPGVMRRPGQLEEDYGSRGIGGLGPNGQTMEPLAKRPRMSPTGPRPYLPPRVGLIPPHGFSGGNSSSTSHDNSLSQGGGQQQGEAGGGIGGGGEQGNAGGPGVALLRGGLHRPPGDSIHNNNPIARPSGSAGPGSGPDGLHQQQQYRGALGPPGPMMMDSAPLPGMMREGEGVGVVRGGAAMVGEAVAQAAQPAMADRESGQGMVEIPDAIPAELNYEVRYESVGTNGEGSGTRGLAVELGNSQDLRSVVCCVRFSTDGTKIAAGSHSCVKVFDVSTFRQLYVCRKIPEQGNLEADPYVRAVCFSPDGRSVVAGMERNSAKVLVLGEEGGQQGAITLSGHESEVYSLDWVSNMIASGSGDGRIRLWDSMTGACQASLGGSCGPQDGVTSVVLKQDTKMVAAASIDRIVHVWSTQTHKLLHRLDGHTESVYAVTFSHCGNRLVSGGLDKTIRVWDLGPGSEGPLSPQAQTLPGGHSDYVLSVCFSQDGKYIISGSKDRSVTIWDAKLMKKVATVIGFKNSVIGVSASPTNGTFATGSGDNLVCVWKYGDRHPSSSLPPAAATAANPGGVAVGSKRPRSTSPQSSREDNGKVAGAEVDGKGGDSGGGGPSSNVGGEGGEGRRAGHGEEGRCGTGKEGKAGEGQAVETGGDDDKSKEKFKQERTKEGEETLAVPKPSTTSAGSEGGGKDSGAGSSGSSRTACDKRDATAAGNAAGKDSVASPQSSANVPRNSPAAAAAAAAAGKPGPINEDSDHGKAVHGGGYDSVESRLVEAEKRRGAGGESGGDSPAKTLAGEGRGGDRSRSRSTSAERRPLPPKKDIQRRDSPPVGGDA